MNECEEGRTRNEQWSLLRLWLPTKLGTRSKASIIMPKRISIEYESSIEAVGHPQGGDNKCRILHGLKPHYATSKERVNKMGICDKPRNGVGVEYSTRGSSCAVGR